MAEETTEKQSAPEQAKDAKENKETPSTGSRSLLPWIIMAAVVLICAGAGFGLGRLLAKGKTPQTVEVNEPKKPEFEAMLDEKASAEKTWYHKCDPVVANLNEPGATRYVSMGFTLEMSGQLGGGSKGGGEGGGGGGNPYLAEKQPLIANWLTIYLSSLSLADVQGEKNLNRILADVREGLNAKLFNGKPLIVNVYFYQNAIQ
jgi:flagellar basal body-associated protein FliL